MQRGKYIVFEGADGTGKSTQAKGLTDLLNQNGMKTVLFREPGGEVLHEHQVALKIRTLLADGENNLNPLCELGLFTANRALIMDEIQKYLNQGIHVISDRNYLSSVVYQGFGRGLSIAKIIEVTSLFEILNPDFVLLYTVDTTQSRERITARGALDRFEAETDEFIERIAEGYRQLPLICEQLKLPYLQIATDDKSWEKYLQTVYNTVIPILTTEIMK